MSTAIPGRHSRHPGQPRRRFGLFPVRRRESAIADAIEAGPQDPGAAQASAPLRARLRAPVMTEPELATLARVAERLRALPPALPAAYLRDIVPGQDATHEPLRGLPAFAGTDQTPDGDLAAGIWLGDGDGTGRFVLDGFEAAWFRALQAAAAEAAEVLEAAKEAAA